MLWARMFHLKEKLGKTVESQWTLALPRASFESWTSYVTWVNFLTPLGLNFLTCKMKIIILLLWQWMKHIHNERDTQQLLVNTSFLLSPLLPLSLTQLAWVAQTGSDVIAIRREMQRDEPDPVRIRIIRLSYSLCPCKRVVLKFRSCGSHLGAF